jgi:uncharacterized radical SAM superfamily Fe-S cluster-containing enzyme
MRLSEHLRRDLGRTESLCQHCLRRVPARRVTEGDTVYLEKTCPEHGPQRAVIWRGRPELTQWQRPKQPSRPPVCATPLELGCPFDCGLCPEHGQHTCTALVEVTQRCGLRCPICFANAGQAGAEPDPSLDQLARLFTRIMADTGGCNLQLSGGEPTERPDLLEIIGLAKQAGFPFVQLNSNGLAFAGQEDYARRCRQAGLDSVFLQFDGTREDIHQALRGRPLLEDKLTAIARMGEAGLGVVLVATVKPRVNDDDLGGLVRLAAGLSPGVRGVHFQPISYFGRYPTPPGDADRITLPEVMARLEEQTQGEVQAAHFHPPGCEHHLCSFSGKFLVLPSGRLRPLGGAGQEPCCEGPPPSAAAGARQAKAYVAAQWSAPASSPAPIALSLEEAAPLDLDAFLARAGTHRLAISGMAFQDAATLDLERLRGCCIHVATLGGKLIPFCAYNLTSAQGRPLFRGLG